MLGEECKLFINTEDILCKKIYSFESLEFQCVEQTACCAFISIQPIWRNQSSPIEVPSLDNVHIVGRLSIELVVHGVGEIPHLGIDAAPVEFGLLAHVFFLLTWWGVLETDHLVPILAAEVIAWFELFCLFVRSLGLFLSLLRISEGLYLKWECLSDDHFFLISCPIFEEIQLSLIDCQLDPSSVYPSDSLFELPAYSLDCSFSLDQYVIIILLEKIGKGADLGLGILDEVIGNSWGPLDEGESITEERHGSTVGDSVALVDAQHCLEDVHDI
jgi:hypothetical protein